MKPADAPLSNRAGLCRQTEPPRAALQGITANAAYVLHMDDQIGSLGIGKKADFVILAQNPLRTAPAKLRDIKVLGTVFEGVPATTP